jgi:hypothetical protein
MLKGTMSSCGIRRRERLRHPQPVGSRWGRIALAAAEAKVDDFAQELN